MIPNTMGLRLIVRGGGGGQKRLKLPLLCGFRGKAVFGLQQKSQ